MAYTRSTKTRAIKMYIMLAARTDTLLKKSKKLVSMISQKNKMKIAMAMTLIIQIP